MSLRGVPLIELTWTESSHEFESLAVSLRALLLRADVRVGYADLLAALGLGSAVVAAIDDTFGWWASHARDAALDTVAARYGLRLRCLHPPEAAVGLRRSIEFAQHFHDSYEPLIRAAIEHGLPALVWRGWPPPRDHMWGVVTDAPPNMLSGYSLWHGGHPLPMTGPAHQVYIVEDAAPPVESPTHEELFELAVDHQRAQWAGTWCARPNILTGRDAWDAWAREIRAPSESFDPSLPVARQIMQLARTLASARRHFAAWLREVGPRLQPRWVQLAARWSRTCDRIASLLSPFESDDAVRARLGEPGGADQIRTAIADCADLEAALVAQFEQFSLNSRESARLEGLNDSS
ncbi:MAG: hypothetical protein D6744_04635 [Planctomycetota bacterium]|nr:MAG: hypothetical protein D6744_04635 [Planctomycetota bacterium]